MWGNRILVRFLFLKTRTEAKRSNPKFRFLWLFSKPNLSHTNSQYLSHSHKAFTFFTLRTLSDSKWSWNQIIGSTPNEHLENRRPKCKCTHTRKTAYTFFVFYNWSTKNTEPTVFQNRTHGFSQNRTELEKSIPHIPISKQWEAHCTWTKNNQARPFSSDHLQCCYWNASVLACLAFYIS